MTVGRCCGSLRVVNHNNVVVNRHAAGTDNDGIAHDLMGKFNVPTHDIVKANGVFGNLEADGRCFARRPPPLRLGWC